MRGKMNKRLMESKIRQIIREELRKKDAIQDAWDELDAINKRFNPNF